LVGLEEDAGVGQLARRRPPDAEEPPETGALLIGEDRWVLARAGHAGQPTLRREASQTSTLVGQVGASTGRARATCSSSVSSSGGRPRRPPPAR